MHISDEMCVVDSPSPLAALVGIWTRSQTGCSNVHKLLIYLYRQTRTIICPGLLVIFARCCFAPLPVASSLTSYIGLGAHAEKSVVLTRRLRACNHRSMYLIAAVATTLLVAYSMTWFRSKIELGGKHVIITGGSEGLGFSLAKEFCMKGSHVTIVARTKSKLDQAIVELQEMALPEVQVQALTADVTQYEQERTTGHAELPRSPMLV